MPSQNQPRRKQRKKKPLRPIKLTVSTDKPALPTRARVISLANEFMAQVGIGSTSVVQLLNKDKLPTGTKRPAELKATQKLLLELQLVRRVRNEPARGDYYILRVTSKGVRLREANKRIEHCLSPVEQRLIIYRNILGTASEFGDPQKGISLHWLDQITDKPYTGTIADAIQFLLDDGALRAKGYNLFITEKGNRFQNASDDRIINHLESDSFIDRLNRFSRRVQRRVVNYGGL
jgi:hypothetical protein